MEDSAKRGASSLMRLASRFVAGLTRLENYLAVQSIVLILAALLWVMANLVSRYGFNSPIKGTYALIALALLPITFLPWSYVMATKGFMRITFLLDKFPGRVYYVIWMINSIIALVGFTLLFMAVLVFTRDLYRLDIIDRGALDVVEWPFYALGTVGVLLFVIRLVIEVVDSVRNVIKPPPERPAAFIGG